MTRILKVGLDVHSTSFTICVIEPVFCGEDRVIVNFKIEPDYKMVLEVIDKVKEKLGKDDDYDVVCGYEAGCLGYWLHDRLTAAGTRCDILAPTTMLTEQGKRIKTDKRDALMIAKCLANGGYHPVYVPKKEDNAVKEYIRMRTDHKNAQKIIKQQICAFCLRHECRYSHSLWTGKHLEWLRKLELSPVFREILDEYLTTYEELSAKIERLDKRIEEFAGEERYQEKARKLGCFLGIKTHTALSLIVETGDFTRFPKGDIYAAYLGLVPGENSSGPKHRQGAITKKGNSNLRRLLIEAAQGICRGKVGHKSKELRGRQNGNSAEVIAYADKANLRLRRKYYKMINRGKKKNVAVAAVARELACFVWGMMTDNISVYTPA